MKKLHKIGLLGIIYMLIGTVLIWIIKDFDLATWFLLGAAVSMFNYSQLIYASKSMKQSKMMFNVLIRYTMMAIILFVAYEKTNADMLTMIIVLIGLLTSKVGVLLYHLFFFKKEVRDVSITNSTEK